MNKFLIYYYRENNDECFDHEIIINADNIEEAIKFFKSRVREHKKTITTITMLPNENNL